MTAYQLPTFVWPATILGVCALATWRGRNHERLAAGGLLASWALSLVSYERALQTQWGIVAVDACLLALLIWISLRSRRFWPMFAAGFHVLAMLTHLARALDATFSGWTYMTAEMIWSYLVLLAVGYGAWSAPSHQATYAADSVDTPPGDTLR